MYMSNSCCIEEKQTDSVDKNRVSTFFSHIKASVFCGVKGYFTFELAFISYINYSLHYFFFKHSDKNRSQPLAKKYDTMRKGAAFAMKRNLIPFFEVVIIMPLICFGLPKILGVNSILKDHLYLYCTFACITLMITACFIVRTFCLREKLTERLSCYNSQQITDSFKQDDIRYPIYDKENGNLMFNFPDQADGSKDKYNIPSRRDFILLVLLNFITLPLKLLQATTMLSLSIVELGEAIFNFPFDLLTCCNSKNKFVATRSNMQRSGHLFYGFIRNSVDIALFPIMIFVNSHYQVCKNMSSPFACIDDTVAEFIGTPESTCCSV